MEPWQHPDPAGLTDTRRYDLETSFRQALWSVETTLADLPAAALWWQPAPSIPSIGARMQHIIGSARRLAAYAFDPPEDPAVFIRQAEVEWQPGEATATALLDTLRGVLEAVQARLDEADLDAICPVGRKKLPVRRAALLHHIAEHTTLHAGQLVLLWRLWQAGQVEQGA
jgi:uncharacterized damage-inducible protein DinB